eukprot:7160203-Alexandrium_andersonii.AAC.1
MSESDHAVAKQDQQQLVKVSDSEQQDTVMPQQDGMQSKGTDQAKQTCATEASWPHQGVYACTPANLNHHQP